MEPHNDPPIDEIRDLRRRISERYGNDPEKLVAYYEKLQEQYRDRLIRLSDQRQPAEHDAA